MNGLQYAFSMPLFITLKASHYSGVLQKDSNNFEVFFFHRTLSPYISSIAIIALLFH